MRQQQFNEMMAAIAQGVVNIAEGMTRIEKGSRIYNAMEQLCAAVVRGEIVPRPKRPEVKVESYVIGVDRDGAVQWFCRTCSEYVVEVKR